MIGKGRYSHFMLKEIFEQPQVIGDSLGAMLNPQTNAISLPGIDSVFDVPDRMTIVACGTSYYAGLVARYWLERIAVFRWISKLPVSFDIVTLFFEKEGLFYLFLNPVRRPIRLRLCVTAVNGGRR